MRKEKTAERKENSFAESNLVVLLKSFSKEEMKQLEKFVHSPFHNNRSEVSRFFDLLKGYYPAFEDKEFTKTKLYSKLYYSGKYKDDVIRRLSSNLFKLAEEFGAYKTFRSAEADYNKYLLGFYLSKSPGSLYLKQQKKTEALLNQQKLRDADYFLNVNFLEEYKRIYFSKNDTLAKKIDLQLQIDSVWKYSIITLFKLYRLAYDYNIYTNKKYSIKLLDVLFKIAEEPGFGNSKALKIWCQFLRFNTSVLKDEKAFYKLKNLLEKNIGIFNREDGFYIYIVLLNYCYDMNMDPGKNFLREEFQIISQMLKNDLLMQGSNIDSEWFMYSLLRALNAGEIIFAEKFINNFISKVPEPERYNTLSFANAALAISKKDYKSALKYLNVPAHNNFSEKLFSNRLYLQIYYELGLSEPFFYIVDRFKHLIKYESSFNKDSVKIRLNFINFSVKLFRLKINEKNISLVQIKKEFMNSKTYGRSWIQEKIKEFEKKKK